MKLVVWLAYYSLHCERQLLCRHRHTQQCSHSLYNTWM